MQTTRAEPSDISIKRGEAWSVLSWHVMAAFWREAFLIHVPAQMEGERAGLLFTSRGSTQRTYILSSFLELFFLFTCNIFQSI